MSLFTENPLVGISLMLLGVMLLILLFISASLSWIATKLESNSESSPETDDMKENIESFKVFRTILLYLIPLLVLFPFAHSAIVAAGWEAHLIDWLGLVVRWVHVVFGIAWIGASFYFIFLENSLNRTEGLRDELAGNLWAVHGGGFYYLEKYKTSPAELPKTLHWFKYEAYFTWLSGFFLLMIVYYFNAKAFMVDPEIMDISGETAVKIGLGTLLIGWFIYDALCKSALAQNKTAFAVVGFLLVVLVSFGLSQVLSGRAAYMHVGAMLGTIMAGNVFFVIIPAQKAMVKAAKYKRPLDLTLGKNAGLRSLHNNYITLPVIFVMISNHFPATFGDQFNWIVLAVLTLASVAVKHYINLHERGEKATLMLPFAALCLFALVIVTAPRSQNSNDAKVTFAEANAIIQQRCVSCHGAKPTDDVQKVAPNGVMFDKPEQIQKYADKIMLRAVQTKSMPQGNKTGITDEEREIIGRWIKQGAVIE